MSEQSVRDLIAELKDVSIYSKYGSHSANSPILRGADLAARAADALEATLPGEDEREALANTLRAQGLTDEPEKFDGNIHSWRCEHPDRYGRCACFAELTDAILAAGFSRRPIDRDALIRAVTESLDDDRMREACGVPIGASRGEVVADAVIAHLEGER